MYRIRPSLDFSGEGFLSTGLVFGGKIGYHIQDIPALEAIHYLHGVRAVRRDREK
jgi:hypothetical protein